MCSPLESPWRILPSYLDLWDTQASDTSSEPPSQYIRAILVSHLLLEDAQVTLLYYTGEMQRLFPSVIEEEYLTISLSESHVFEYSVR